MTLSSVSVRSLKRSARLGWKGCVHPCLLHTQRPSWALWSTSAVGFHIFLEAAFSGFHRKPARFHPRVLITPHLTAGVPAQGRESRATGPPHLCPVSVTGGWTAERGGRWGQRGQALAQDRLTPEQRALSPQNPHRCSRGCEKDRHTWGPLRPGPSLALTAMVTSIWGVPSATHPGCQVESWLHSTSQDTRGPPGCHPAPRGWLRARVSEGKCMAPARQGLRSREDTQPVPGPGALLSRRSHGLTSHAPHGPRPRDMEPSFQRCSGLKPSERLTVCRARSGLSPSPRDPL